MKGYIQLYTGEGKGKTTAAMGLALRAVGAGKKVYIAQFVKGMHYSEIDAIHQYLPTVFLRQYGRNCFIKKQPVEEDIEAARKGLFEAEEMLQSGEFDLVILDEVCIALYYALFSLNELLQVLDKRPAGTEVVLTGRYAPAGLMEYADLVTEMKEIRHYYRKGVQARKGIEF